MVVINYEKGKAVRATNGKILVYNFGEGLPEKYLTRIVNALGQEKCAIDTVFSIFIDCDIVKLHGCIAVFKNSELLVVIE